MTLFSRNAFRHRFLKFLVSLGFWLLRSITEALARLLGFKRPGHAVGIYYHQVLPEDRNRFARQMDHLVRWAVPISADHMQALPSGRRHALVTADDGWLSFIENALPELKARQIPVAIFVISDHMGDSMGEHRESDRFSGRLACAPAGYCDGPGHDRIAYMLTLAHNGD